MPTFDKNVGEITEHLFRETYQEVFSSLTVKFGMTHIDLIEDALQDTFYKALKSWKHDNYPSNPKGWLFEVTKNHIINELRRSTKSVSIPEQSDQWLATDENPFENSGDAQLKVLLACAKLKLEERVRLIFTLKSVCGFGVSEIANSLLLTEENVYKNLQRGKKKLQQVPKSYFEDQAQSELSDEDVRYLEMIIYFMFNEGYDTVNSASVEAINKDICYEAVRLAHLLEKSSEKESSKHLLSLCYFHMARFDSRSDESREFISLRFQDRKKWDVQLIHLGFNYLTKPKRLNRFYIESLIASLHITAKTFDETDWGEILKAYNMLLKLNNTSVVRLNRSICLFELGRKREAIDELRSIKTTLGDKYMYYSMSMAEYLEDKDIELSKFWYRKSLENTKQEFRKQLIKKKLLKLKS